MKQGISKSVLSEPRRRLLQIMQRLNFGRIERLLVVDGEPVLGPETKIFKKLKMGSQNTVRPEIDLEDFRLKQQVAELLASIAEVGNGEIDSILVQHGLPFSAEVVHAPAMHDGE